MTPDTEQFTPLPDHTQLPAEDGTFVKNFQEHPQSILLTESIRPILDRVYGDRHYVIGQDSGIYWRNTDPPLRGAVSPDWFYVPNVPPTLNGQTRRSYVLWQEIIPPQIVLEFVSGTGAEERDQTPWEGKFWIYETVIRPAYYGIYEVEKAHFELYRHRGVYYEPVPPNDRQHFEISHLNVELGLWPGTYQGMELPWLRWWDSQGVLLPTGEERADQAEAQAARLAAQLRALGVEPEGF